MPRRLRQLRKEHLLTIRDLAARAGVSTRTVLRIEHGLQTPQPGTIRKLSAALDVEPAEVQEFRVAMGLATEEGDKP